MSTDIHSLLQPWQGKPLSGVSGFLQTFGSLSGETPLVGCQWLLNPVNLCPLPEDALCRGDKETAQKCQVSFFKCLKTTTI